MFLNYFSNLPNPPDDPADDVSGMQINSASINSWVGVDHVGFKDNEGGYHKVIHIPNQTIGGQALWNPVTVSGVPAAISATAIANVQQIFSMTYTTDSTVSNTDTQLFAMTGAGIISQLTGQLIGTPVAGTNLNDGWAWIGGILIQWGIVTTASSGSFASGSAAGNVTFKDRISGAIPFPNNVFEVFPIPFWSNSGGPPNGSGSVNITRSDAGPTSTSNTQFNWVFNSNSSKYVGFSWFAIGN